MRDCERELFHRSSLLIDELPQSTSSTGRRRQSLRDALEAKIHRGPRLRSICASVAVDGAGAIDICSLGFDDIDGMWRFRVTDLWEIDNGYLFDWSIQFDPSLVTSCSGPIIE